MLWGSVSRSPLLAEGSPELPAALFNEPDSCFRSRDVRRLILGLTLLPLAACNNEQQAAETNGVDQAVTAETIGGNDVTAIDAATNDAANMAADAEVGFNALTANEVAEANAVGNETGDGNAE